MFTKADKGNVTVCLNKSDYTSKMLELLSDQNRYRVLKNNRIGYISRDGAENSKIRGSKIKAIGSIDFP